MPSNTIQSAESMTIRQAFEEFYQPTMRQASPKTIESYKGTINAWERLTDNCPIGDITNRTLAEFRDSILETGVKPVTFNKHRRTLRAILRRLGPQEYRNPLGEGIIARIPYVASLRTEREYPRIATANELNSLYRSCDAMRWPRCWVDPSLWWRSLIVVGFQVAMRLGDLMQMSDDQFDFEKMQVEWVARKTTKRQIVPLHPVTADHVRALVGRHEKLFPGGQAKKQLYENWHMLQNVAGIEQHFGFHTLRKTAATLYEQAAPGSARFILGHSATNVTDAFYINPLAIMREAVERLDIPVAFCQQVHTPPRPRPFNRRDWKLEGNNIFYRMRRVRLSPRAFGCLRAIIISGGVANFEKVRAIAFEHTAGCRTNETIKSTISQLRTRLRNEFRLPAGWDPLPWDDNQKGWTIALQ